MTLGAPVPVFLIHFDAPEWLRSSVASVLASEHADVRVVVVDNGGAEVGLLPAAAERVVTGTNLGYTGAANLALDLWTERFPGAPVAIIGSHDLHVEPECVRALSQAMAANPDLGILGPVLEQAPRSTGGRWRAFDRRQHFDERVATSRGPVRVDWVSGTCLAVRKACVDQVGVFDAGLGSYLEDVDICLRARDAGWAVAVEPSARARGLGSGSGGSHDRIAMNRLRLLRKRQGRVGVLIGAAEALQRLAVLSMRAAANGQAVRGECWTEGRSIVRAFRIVPGLLASERSASSC